MEEEQHSFSGLSSLIVINGEVHVRQSVSDSVCFNSGDSLEAIGCGQKSKYITPTSGEPYCESSREQNTPELH